MARHLAYQQGENLHLVQRLLGAGGFGRGCCSADLQVSMCRPEGRRYVPCRAQARRYGGAQRLKKCLTRAGGLEGLVKIVRRGEINPALLDQL